MHIVATTDETTMKLYKNGVEFDTETRGTVPVVERTAHYIGKSWWSADGDFHGTIAYLRFWHGVALDETEVAYLYSRRDITCQNPRISQSMHPFHIRISELPNPFNPRISYKKL